MHKKINLKDRKIFTTKRSNFSASHSHKGKVEEVEHTHTFFYEVTLYEKLNDEGFLVDFKALESVMKKEINSKLMYKNLNEILDPPTSEHLAVFIYEKMKTAYQNFLYSVKVYENKENFVEYRGE